MTAQASEIIEYRGQQYALTQYPLYPFLKERKDFAFGMYSTAHWRGYQGYWKLENNKLFLTAIESANYTLIDIFNKIEPVFADWYSGALTIGIGEDMFNDWGIYHEQYLWLKVENGIITDRKIIKDFHETNRFEFGKYKGKSVTDVIKGKISSGPVNICEYFIGEVISFMVKEGYDKRVIVPYFEITGELKALVAKMRKSDLRYFLTKDFLALDKGFYIGVLPAIDEAEAFSLFLENLLSSDFNRTLTLRKEDLQNAETAENTLLFNPDPGYIGWAIKEVEGFSIYPHIIEETFLLKTIKHFEIKRLNSTIFEYSPVFEECEYSFSEDVKLINREKFEKKNAIVYDQLNRLYSLDLNGEELYNKYGQFLNEDFTQNEDNAFVRDDYGNEDDSYSDYERDYFDAMTDGQLGDYDDYIERGGNMDDIDTWARG